jgi:uncharacterized membrane protein YvlD (DUF360 family)
MTTSTNPISLHVRSIVLDMILTLLTCGLYNVYVQAKQIDAVNDMIGQKKYHFFKWLFLSLITCTLYHVYHEYIMHKDICAALGNPNANDPLVSLILASLGLWIVADAIQQHSINKFYGSDSV